MRKPPPLQGGGQTRASKNSTSRVSITAQSDLSTPFVDVEQLWHCFVMALARPCRSTDPADGIAAGKAFSAFVQAFVPPPPFESERRT